MLQILLAALIGPLAPAGQLEVTRTGDVPSELTCEIRSTDSGGSLQLEAVAMSSIGASGEYDFVISKTGGGGSSDISQGGTFDVGPGEETVLGEVTLGPGEEAQVRADLTVVSADGTMSCTDRFPAPL